MDLGDHRLDSPLGQASPLAKLYELDAIVLLLGVGFDICTMLHLAEQRAWANRAKVTEGAPLIVDGLGRWLTYEAAPLIASAAFVPMGDHLLELAQHTAPQMAPTAAQPTNDGDIVVTGSRVQASGFTAPTPTKVISAAQLNQNAEPNVFTTITQLPSLQGSSGSATNTFSTSSGQQELSSFSLRGLGTIRTLTLIDGQRVVGAYYTGVTDVSLFPQLLIQHVDVVNGGASASYGSDAVGGVVNFITDTHFQGFKGNIQGGITNYGDDGQGEIQLAFGRNLMDNRLHFVVSSEFAKEGGVGPGDYGLALGSGPIDVSATI